MMKTVMVTGATGFLGHRLVEALLVRGDTRIIAIMGKPGDKVNPLPENEKVVSLSMKELFMSDVGHIDTVIHTAFSRGDNLPGLTASITLTHDLVSWINEKDIDSIINISTQGLYKGLEPGQDVDENGEVEPGTAYGLAKWGVEKMLSIGCRKHSCNIRMASLSANAKFLSFFVNSVKEGQDIIVTAPRQFASIMDVSDATNGILSIENLPMTERRNVYNLGPGVQYSILDFARMTNQVGQSLGYKPVGISVEDGGRQFAICMDCRKLKAQTGWECNTDLKVIIHNMFNS